jgi:hypothetical protein
VDVDHQPTDLVVGRESGCCDVELDHQGAMVADGGGGHPGPAGLDRPGWIVRRIWSSCWVGAELGQVRPRPVSGQPRREANTSTVEGMFRSPTSSRGAARDPTTTCSSRSWRTLWPWRLDRWVAATVTEGDPTWMLHGGLLIPPLMGPPTPPLMGPPGGGGPVGAGHGPFPLVRTLESADRFIARRWASFVGPLRTKSWRRTIQPASGPGALSRAI